LNSEYKFGLKNEQYFKLLNSEYKFGLKNEQYFYNDYKNSLENISISSNKIFKKNYQNRKIRRLSFDREKKEIYFKE
jgi:hypothetical protein